MFNCLFFQNVSAGYHSEFPSGDKLLDGSRPILWGYITLQQKQTRSSHNRCHYFSILIFFTIEK